MEFQVVKSSAAKAKVAITGSTGSGKTRTATSIAIGIHKCLKRKKLPDCPINFLDTERGFPFVADAFKAAKVNVGLSNTRAFVDLVPAIQMTAKQNGILIIDSISHFWDDITESYQRTKKRTKLDFQDRAGSKQEWGKFTKEFLHSSCHVIMCGRLGYEYDYVEDEESGKRELQKTAPKMKAESETGYEASLLILMTRRLEFSAGNPEESQQVHIGTVLKDRADLIDGKSFVNPTFKDFYPHFKVLDLTGDNAGIDSDKTSDHIVPKGSGAGRLLREERDVALDEVKELLSKHFPGTTGEAKKTKADLCEKFFATRSWVKIKTLDLYDVKIGRNLLWEELEGRTYGMETPEPAAEVVAVDTEKESEIPF